MIETVKTTCGFDDKNYRTYTSATQQKLNSSSGRLVDNISIQLKNQILFSAYSIEIRNKLWKSFLMEQL
jgi:hypothetical protein